jgi:hypothetical protein
MRIDGARAVVVGRGDRLDIRTVSPAALLRLRAARSRAGGAPALLRRVGLSARLVVLGVPVARI